MFGFVSSAIETALMVLEPAYRTYKELKATDETVQGKGGGTVAGAANVAADAAGHADGKRVSDPDVRRNLLMHWIVYATFRAFDCLAREWLPMYNVIKIGIVVWLRVGGTTTVYEKLIGPFLADNEATVDQWLYRYDQARDTVTTATATLGATAMDAVAGGEDDDK